MHTRPQHKTPHERMSYLDEKGTGYWIEITDQVGVTVKYDVLSHSENWVQAAPEHDGNQIIWLNLMQVHSLVIAEVAE